MDKFLLAENPLRPDDSGHWIIHLLDPIAIISCTNGFMLHKKNDTTIYKKFSLQNSEWTLSIYHLFTTDFLEEPKDKAIPLLNRAWRWYRSYLEWEDKQIL